MQVLTPQLNKPTQAIRKGFTLLELLVTVVVIVIASVILVPYATMGDSAAGQSASRLAVSNILTAQMDAIATQSYRRVHFYSDGSGWCVEIVELADLANPFDAETALFAEDLVESQGQDQQAIMNFSEDNRFQDIEVSDVLFDGANSSVTFDPTGGIIATDGTPSTGGSFTVNSGAHSWEIALAPLTGKVTVERVDGGGVP